MMISHQASVPTVASVNVQKDSQTAASIPFKAMLGTSRNRCLPYVVDRLYGLSIAAVARSQSSDGRPGLSSGVSSVIERATVQGTVASNR